MSSTEKFLVNAGIVICSLIGIYYLVSSKGNIDTHVDENVSGGGYELLQKFGFNVDDNSFERHSLGFNQNLGDLLLWQGISWDSIIKLDKISSDIYSIRNFRAKKPFTLIRKDSCTAPHCVVYEPDNYHYVKYFLDDQVRVEIVNKDIEQKIETASGEISSSLWLAMKNAGIQGSIIDKMEDALASSVDFYHTQKGDKFKLIFERNYVDGKPAGYGEVISAAYKNEYGEHFAVFYENEKYAGFYDLEGRPTKSTFLRAPLKYSRISSRFNRRRFHPIKKRTIPHLGTDYAAPIGTPIYSVADGVVEIAGYSKNNGKYVKIRHNDIIKTQYLHMHRFAPGIKKGTRVKQGQVIGQVGQTGLATGPHVCFRFWKHGKQVNHLRENFPPKDPLPESQLEDFFMHRDSMVTDLNKVAYPGEVLSSEDNT